MIKVLIADDQELIRQSLSIILGLKEEISVVGGVGDGTEVLEFIAKEKAGYYFDGYSYADYGRCRVYQDSKGKISRDKNYRADNF